MLAQRMAVCVLLCLLNIGLCQKAKAQASPSCPPLLSEPITSLLPDTQDLPGFTRNILLREQASEWTPSGDINGHYVEHMPASTYCYDYIRLNQDATKWAATWVPLKAQPGSYSTIARTFYSVDDKYDLAVEVYFCDSPATAASELAAQVHTTQAVYKPGTPVGTATLGNESWTCDYAGRPVLRYRAGCMIVCVNGGPSGASLKAGLTISFPPAAVEAVGEEILMQAAQQASLTGATSHMAHIAWGGKVTHGKGGYRVSR